MKTFYLLLIFFIPYLTPYGQISQPFDFKRLNAYALQGDVKKILYVLDTLPTNTLSAEQTSIKEKYFHRFRYNDEIIDYNTKDTMLIALLQLYQSYWKKSLLNNEHIKQYDEQLKDSVTAFLYARNYNDIDTTIQIIPDNFGQHLKNFLKQHNYFSATGKTANLYDLFLWSKESSAIYNEQLPEKKIKTTVVFIEDVITMGWEEYATFGKAYPGGWATKELLYCVRKAYDTSSENFKISYLKHESQHFADYKTYPRLTGTDLEYRAKFTELAFAQQTLYELIRSFVRNANGEGRNPHAFANFAVIRDVSRSIFGKDFVADTDQWKTIPAKKINNESKKLIKAHSKALKKAGAKTVTECIK